MIVARFANPFVLALTALLIVSSLAAPAPAQTTSRSNKAPRVFLLDGEHLQSVKARLDSGDKSLAAALDKLRGEADALLDMRAPSVVDNADVPPSGDKRDYMSYGTYWWPNPDTPDGLPFIRRDGQGNKAQIKKADRPALGRMAGSVETLSLAYYCTDDEAYAKKATQLLRTWFLDEKTRMNPHMQYAQAIPGRNTGRDIGIIDGAALCGAFDAVGLLAESKAWKADDQQGMLAWADKMLDWLLTSENGRGEAGQKNNHGTFYDVQTATYALFLGKNDVAVDILEKVGPRRIAKQIEPDGRQPLELARTRAWSYSCANLRGMMALARLGECVNVDLWRYQTDEGAGIEAATRYLVPFGLKQEKWPYEQITSFDVDVFARQLRRAARKYPDADFATAAAQLPLAREDRDRLIEQ
jgi:hypothetical protein